MKTVLLSFDIEEFDMPIEYGQYISLDDQIEFSVQGTNVILNILHQLKIRATFFSTVVFASKAPEIINRLTADGHELASHGYYHSSFKNSHLAESKAELSRLSGQPIRGFRMPRMMPVSNEALSLADYAYNSSLNPVYLPGRYNNFFKPRTLHKTNTLYQLPASATPVIRVPLFWLSFHNFPIWLYKLACRYTMYEDSYVNIYFHPWEFIDLRNQNFNFPRYVSRNSGIKMEERFISLLKWMKKKDYTFSTINDFIEARKGEDEDTPSSD